MFRDYYLFYRRFDVSGMLSLVKTSSDNGNSDFITQGWVDNSTKNYIGIFTCFFKDDIGCGIHFM